MNATYSHSELVPLSRAEIGRRAPAAFAGDHAPHLSERYATITSTAVIGTLEQSGFYPVAARQDHTRSRDPQWARHMVVFQHPAAPAVRQLGELRPSFTLVNSNNGTTGATVFLGLYRLVCTNGLLVGQDWAELKARHLARPAHELVGALGTFVAQGNQLVERAAQWAAIPLSRLASEEFARRAALLRWGEDRASAYDAGQLLEARRVEDSADNLWTVFNRAQENGMRGGQRGVGRSGRRTVARAVNGITQTLQYNQGLWQLAEELAEAA
jgi:predicted RNA binding protein YcfA (HicA-like mRNA interferase family)/xanthosine utilization system XapX-like protein